jgi:hypothetical protein
MAQNPRNRFPVVKRLGRMDAPRRKRRRGTAGRDPASLVASVMDVRAPY